jgi:hypothetical protein
MRTSITVGAMAVMLLLAGCVSAPPVKPVPTPSHSVQIPGLPAGVHPAPLPSDVPNTADARTNVQLTTCEATSDGWRAAGTVTNPGKSKVDYTITVFFTTAKATVIDSAQTKVSLDPGDKKKWSASKQFTAPPDTLCVLRGVG